MISTRSLENLPRIAEIIRITKGLAALDAIVCANWESRYYSFNSKWDAAAGEQMASMRDGSGDEWFARFSAAGAAIKGFAHESFMSPFGSARFTPTEQRGLSLYPGLLSNLPDALSSFVREPAFSPEQTTFLIWRLPGDRKWRVGDIVWPSPEQLQSFGNPDPDGSEELLSVLEGKPEDYASWATDYYEREVSAADVARVLKLQPLDEKLVARLGSKRTLQELREDLDEIGYP